MHSDITKRADAEHAAHIDQIAVAEDAAKRRHRKRHAEKNQRRETGTVNELVERARAVRNLTCLEYRLGERHQQRCKPREAQGPQVAPPVAPQLPGRRIAHCAHIRHVLPKGRKSSANRRQFIVLRAINVLNRRLVLPFLSRLDSSRTTSLRANVSPQRNKIRRSTIAEKSGGGAVADHSEAAPGILMEATDVASFVTLTACCRACISPRK